MSIIIGLILLSLVFIFFEVIVVGIILGILGAAAIIAAAILAYQQYGLVMAITVFLINLICIGLMLVIELKWLPKTKLGKRMFLEKSVESQSTHLLGNIDLMGKIGEAQTTLAPSGRIIIENQEYEGFSQDGLIKKGESVRVVGRDNFRIIVKKN